MFLVFVFPKGQYKSKYGSKSDSIRQNEDIMKKAEKTNAKYIFTRHLT